MFNAHIQLPIFIWSPCQSTYNTHLSYAIPCCSSRCEPFDMIRAYRVSPMKVFQAFPFRLNNIIGIYLEFRSVYSLERHSFPFATGRRDYQNAVRVHASRALSSIACACKLKYMNSRCTAISCITKILITKAASTPTHSIRYNHFIELHNSNLLYVECWGLNVTRVHRLIPVWKAWLGIFEPYERKQRTKRIRD